MAKTEYSAHGIGDLLTAGSQSFVDINTTIAVPNTTIVNRARISNPAADLKANMGIDRVMVQQIQEIQNEFGPNGERVFSAVNDSRDLIRFVGNWQSANNTTGSRITLSSANDYIEVTFYGTALNVLVVPIAAAAGMQISVDGGSATTYFSATQSNLLQNRNYSTNVVISAVSGLTLGLHTVRLTDTAGISQYNGFEIINASANIAVAPGVAYIGGAKAILTAAGSIAHNANVTGTRGGRQLLYLTNTGTIGTAFQPVNATQANLTSTDHTNEEVARTYYPREFGAGRADDFSTLAGTPSARAFTLDDNTTALVGGPNVQILASNEALTASGSGDAISFTFVGTGLDIVSGIAATATSTITIDGVAIITSAVNFPVNGIVYKIVSGLPYGTHTFKITNTSNAASPRIAKFIVYQPKKPTLPVGAIELADYNVMANFVGATVTSYLTGTYSNGVILKGNTREVVYSGTGWIFDAGGVNAAWETGFRINTPTNGDYVQYTFFGTGFEASLQGNNTGVNATVLIDGVAYTGAATLVPAASATWTPGTSTIAWTAATANLFRVTGLTLGVHTVRITKAGTNSLLFDSINIITPIHSYKNNIYSDVQNTLPIGSQGIADTRKTSMVKEPGAWTKSWVQAVGVTSGPSTTATTAVPMPDMSATVKTSGGAIQITCNVTLSSTTASFPRIVAYVNGLKVGTEIQNFMSATALCVSSLNIIVPVAAGTHKVDIFWFTNAGTLVAFGDNRTLTVREM